jgi:hypothetical protein
LAYRFDGAVRLFDTRTATVRVRQGDGSVQEQQLILRPRFRGRS